MSVSSRGPPSGTRRRVALPGLVVPGPGPSRRPPPGGERAVAGWFGRSRDLDISRARLRRPARSLEVDAGEHEEIVTTIRAATLAPARGESGPSRPAAARA